MSTNNSENNPLSRRDFIRSSATVGATTALLATGNFAHAQGSTKIRVGLIGCGGRGTGAAGNCLSSSENVEIYAMGDAFKDRLESSRQNLQNEFKEKVNVTADRSFTGLDAYKQVLAQPVDMVILATPPGFRPIHFPAAVAAGKHIFFEKPVATDAPGIRAVMEAADEAAKKRLCVVAGTQRRHQASYLETIGRIHDGAIGDIVGAQIYWNGGGVGTGTGPKPDAPTLEWQMRHWYFFTWLCGDHIVEQHVHNIDVANWVFKGHPKSAMGVGGRTQRTAEIYGQIFDHFAIDYIYPGDVHVAAMARHWDGTPSNVSEKIVGTKGWSNPNNHISSTEGKGNFDFQGREVNPYVQEHTDLIKAIRGGKYINEGRQVAESTLTAIMGRMAAYTGEIVTWEQALNSNVSLRPSPLAFDTPTPTPAVAVPGRAQVG